MKLQTLNVTGLSEVFEIFLTLQIVHQVVRVCNTWGQLLLRKMPFAFCTFSTVFARLLNNKCLSPIVAQASLVFLQDSYLHLLLLFMLVITGNSFPIITHTCFDRDGSMWKVHGGAAKSKRKL